MVKLKIQRNREQLCRTKQDQIRKGMAEDQKRPTPKDLDHITLRAIYKTINNF